MTSANPAGARGASATVSPDPLLQTESGTTESCWITHDFPAGAKEQNRPPLAGDAECDVCIVGAGIAGLSVAYLLAKAGKRVIVLDDGPAIAASESGRTTGFLNTYPDDGLSILEKKHDLDTVRKAVESYADAIRFIEQVCRDEQIDGAFERREEYLFVHPDGKQQDFLDAEMDVAQRLGLSDFNFADRAPTPGVDTGRAIHMKNQAQLHAGRYLSGLAAAAERQGARIHSRTHVEDLAGGDKGKQAYAKTDDGRTVRCDWLVSCTNSAINMPFTDLLQIHMRQMPYRTYVVALAADSAADVPDVLFSDTLDPYHYARTQTLYGADGRTERIFIVGGEDVKTAHKGHDDPERFDRLEKWARKHWPSLGQRRYAWSGQVFEPDDGLAFIGQDPGGKANSLIYTGDSGQGLTHGTVGALILADHILGRPRAYADIYEPSRISLKPRTIAETVAEGLDSVAKYADYLTGGEVGDESEIAPGSGAVVRKGLKKVAVYRDAAGNFHRCSAVCTHLGGIVHWNAMEKSWDCPVHGSRFAKEDGRCITSPAITPLKALE